MIVHQYFFSAINDSEEISVLPFPPTPVCPADWATLITSFAYLTLARLCDCCREESLDAETF